ncbi:hypothetical protein [Proteiniclasticum sediminis]|uniref:hypothetical protein n=1 Tax=Proteiniclasticum sediminis TaxID=2804028 RepID=UPI001BA812B2|nr:hypothetical protein [Proteiniclasticum sediminis]
MGIIDVRLKGFGEKEYSFIHESCINIEIVLVEAGKLEERIPGWQKDFLMIR